MKRRALSFLARDEGATAVEFAVAAVALVLFVFGVVEFGRMVWTQQVLQATAADTARCLAIGSIDCPAGDAYAVAAAGRRGLSDITTADVVVSANDACGSSVGAFTKVTITYPFSTILPAYVPVPAGGLSAFACFPHG